MNLLPLFRSLSCTVCLVLLLMTSVAGASASDQNQKLIPRPDRQMQTQNPAANSWLHVEGRQILDASGHPVVFHGINSSGMEWGAGYQRIKGCCQTPEAGCWSLPYDSEYDNLAAWGFNMVRLPISWANIEPDPPSLGADGKYVHHFNDNYLDAVESIVNRFGSRHIYVVLSMHQWGWSPKLEIQKHGGKVVHGNGLPGWLFKRKNPGQNQARQRFFANVDGMQDLLADTWGYVANRFKSNSCVVGADLFNEPELKGANNSSQSQIKGRTNLDELYIKLGKSIRQANPNLLLVFQDSRSEPISGPPPFSNLVYSFHSYPQEENWEREKNTWIREHIAKAERWNVPLWVGEFQALAAKDRPYGPDGFVAKTQPELLFYKENGIGWCYWAYQKATRPIAGEHGNGPVNEALVKMLQSGF